MKYLIFVILVIILCSYEEEDVSNHSNDVNIVINNSSDFVGALELYEKKCPKPMFITIDELFDKLGIEKTLHDLFEHTNYCYKLSTIIGKKMPLYELKDGRELLYYHFELFSDFWVNMMRELCMTTIEELETNKFFDSFRGSNRFVLLAKQEPLCGVFKGKE